MSLFELFIKGIKNPDKATRAISKPRLRSKIGRRINKAYYKLRNGSYNEKGIDIFAEDWDNLIILDTCRLDYFKEKKKKHDLPGNLEFRTSRGSQTPEWLWANFHDRELWDTVYITASGMPYHLGVANPDQHEKSNHQKKYSFDLQVHDLINIWKNPPENSYPVLDQGRNVDFLVPAPLAAEEALRQAKKYPNKRLIIHLLEPHDPYIGTKTGNKIHKQTDHPWQDKLRGEIDISRERLQKAYSEKLDIGIEGVKILLKNLKGKTVVTADHGEMLWDRSKPIPTIEILHPDKIYTKELVKVPWHTVKGERKTIISEKPENIPNDEDFLSDDNLDQLKALGYK